MTGTSWVRLSILTLVFSSVLAVAPTTSTSEAAVARVGSVCTTFGHHWCIGATGQFGPSPGDSAVNKLFPGKTIVFTPGPGGTATLHLKNANGLCLAPKGPNNHVIAWRLCNVIGSLWYWRTSRNSHNFVSIHYKGLLLSASNTLGDVLAACPPGGCSGKNFTLQQFTGPRR